MSTGQRKSFDVTVHDVIRLQSTASGGPRYEFTTNIGKFTTWPDTDWSYGLSIPSREHSPGRWHLVLEGKLERIVDGERLS